MRIHRRGALARLASLLTIPAMRPAPAPAPATPSDDELTALARRHQETHEPHVRSARALLDFAKGDMEQEGWRDEHRRLFAINEVRRAAYMEATEALLAAVRARLDAGLPLEIGERRPLVVDDNPQLAGLVDRIRATFVVHDDLSSRQYEEALAIDADPRLSPAEQKRLRHALNDRMDAPVEASWDDYASALNELGAEMSARGQLGIVIAGRLFLDIDALDEMAGQVETSRHGLPLSLFGIGGGA